MWPFKKRKILDGVPYEAQDQFINSRTYEQLISLALSSEIPSHSLPKEIRASCGCTSWYSYHTRSYQIHHTENCKGDSLRPPASFNCRNCGAPVWGSLCKYCGTRY